MEFPLFGTMFPRTGERLSGVFDVKQKIDVNLFSCMRLPGGSPALLEGDSFPVGRISIYDALVSCTEDVLMLSITPDTWWTTIPEKSDCLSPCLVDLCAGTGAMSVGASYLGADPMLAVDWNPVAVGHLHANHKGSVLQLDLAAPDAAKTIHKACRSQPGTTFMGFPCQPHSCQGQQRGSDDPRARVLWHGLHIAFMLQTQTLIVECTPAAGLNQDVCSSLDTIAHAMGWTILTTTLDLQDVWPCKRNRWWALLMPSEWNTYGLHAWNIQSPFDHIGAILSNWGCWTHAEEFELQLTEHELQMYHDTSLGHDQRLLTLDGVASTLLHSYANALGPCPCGCRQQAFHIMTLRRGGLRGYYVLSHLTGHPRFLHPREAGLLLGLPDSTQYPHDVRTSLALLGLIASPLQVIWIYSHLKTNHAMATHQGPIPSAVDWLWAYTQELIAQIGFDTTSSGQHAITAELHAFGASLNLSLGHIRATVQQLLSAERISLGWNESSTIWAADQRLGRDEILFDHVHLGLALHCQAGPSERTQPCQPIAIAITHRGDLHVHLAMPGRFLFELLADMGLPLIRKVITARGQILPVDLRVWHPMTVTTLADIPWTQPNGFFRIAHGEALAEQKGLHDGHIWACIQSLLQDADQSAQEALRIHPAMAAALQYAWISPQHVLQLQLDFANSSGRIICIFEAHGHWSLLWGERRDDGLQWLHCDGLPGLTNGVALDLATSISTALGLDFCPPQLHCSTPQIDPHTCGTIALVHLFHLLYPSFLIPCQDVSLLHSWILRWNSCRGSIYATGPADVTFSMKQMQVNLDWLHDQHIQYGIQWVMTHSPVDTNSLLVISPVQAETLRRQGPRRKNSGIPVTLGGDKPDAVICIFVTDSHWTLLFGTRRGQTLQWTHFDGLCLFGLWAQHLAKTISLLLGLDFCPLTRVTGILQLEPHTCGVIALANLWQSLNPGFTVPTAAIPNIQEWLLQLPLPLGCLFAAGLTTLSTDQMNKLTQLLIDHGVPELKASERAALVVQKLGAPAILAAFVAKNNWAHLKQQASKPGIALRLVQPEELTRHAEKTAAAKYGAGISNHKAKKKAERLAPQTPHFDPDALLLQPGNFKDSDGDEVPQIMLHQIEAEAHGIAIATRTQSLQWLQQQGSISTSALALLITEELPPELLNQFGASKVSFPALYKGTGEPVLIFGSLKNLGDQKVNRHIAGNLTQIDIIENVVVRLHVYRDELSEPWDTLIKSPVRLLQQLLPPLQLCAGEGCGADCPKTHQPVGEHLDSIIMEVWGRSFGKVEGGRQAAPEANYFSVFLRVPASVLRPLLLTTVAGIYMDPRKDKSPDDQFRVIWLPSLSATEAQHANKTCAKALGLVRMRQRYGIRVEADDEESAFKQLKPEATFIATRVQRTFQLFPLPHGLQRAGLIKILSDLKWVAKPLQPGRGQQEGISWQVGSSDPPPANFFSSFGKEVLITETTKSQSVPRPPSFLASQKTHQHMRTEATASSSTSGAFDPWTEPSADPWKTWKSTSTPAAFTKPAAGKTHLAEVKDQLREELQASMRKDLADYKQKVDADMDDSTTTAQEERFRKIEHTMDEIQAQQSQFNQWFTQVGQATSATENAIQTINYTLSTHQQELQGLHHEVQKVSESVGQTLQKTLANHQNEMSADFATRFDKLEAMFAKKQRSE